MQTKDSYKIRKSSLVQAFACVVTMLLLTETTFLLWLWCTNRITITPASLSSTTGVQQKIIPVTQVSTSILKCTFTTVSKEV